jgi:hypothetical protein
MAELKETLGVRRLRSRRDAALCRLPLLPGTDQAGAG